MTNIEKHYLLAELIQAERAGDWDRVEFLEFRLLEIEEREYAGII